MLYGDWCEGENTGKPSSILDVTTPESISNVVKLLCVSHGQVGAPAALIFDDERNARIVVPYRDLHGLLWIFLVAVAHGVRDKDVDEETVAMFKQRPNLVLIPNLPERGVN